MSKDNNDHNNEKNNNNENFYYVWDNKFINLKYLSIWRILIGMTVIYDILNRFGYYTLLYTDDGFWTTHQAKLSERNSVLFYNFEKQFNPYFIWGDQHSILIIFVIHYIFAVMYTFGIFTHMAAFALWFMQRSITNRNFWVTTKGDMLLLMVLFWSIWVPINRYYSIDNIINQYSIKSNRIKASWAVIALVCQPLLVMFFVGWEKLENPLWTNGTYLFHLFTAPRESLYLGKEIAKLFVKFTDIATLLCTAIPLFEISAPIIITLIPTSRTVRRDVFFVSIGLNVFTMLTTRSFLYPFVANLTLCLLITKTNQTTDYNKSKENQTTTNTKTIFMSKNLFYILMFCFQFSGNFGRCRVNEPFRPYSILRFDLTKRLDQVLLLSSSWDWETKDFRRSQWGFIVAIYPNKTSINLIDDNKVKKTQDTLMTKHRYDRMSLFLEELVKDRSSNLFLYNNHTSFHYINKELKKIPLSNVLGFVTHESFDDNDYSSHDLNGAQEMVPLDEEEVIYNFDMGKKEYIDMINKTYTDALKQYHEGKDLAIEVLVDDDEEDDDDDEEDDDEDDEETVDEVITSDKKSSRTYTFARHFKFDQMYISSSELYLRLEKLYCLDKDSPRRLLLGSVQSRSFGIQKTSDLVTQIQVKFALDCTRDREEIMQPDERIKNHQQPVLYPLFQGLLRAEESILGPRSRNNKLKKKKKSIKKKHKKQNMSNKDKKTMTDQKVYRARTEALQREFLKLREMKLANQRQLVGIAEQMGSANIVSRKKKKRGRTGRKKLRMRQRRKPLIKKNAEKKKK